MDCRLNPELARNYKSQSQKARVMTEAWAEEQMFCPRCGCTRIRRFPNNRAVQDFFCPACQSEFELKSKRGIIRNKVMDGTYRTMIDRITGNHNPDFLLLSYDPVEPRINQLWIVLKHFFVPGVIEKRKPLPAHARRAGWTGCNILLSEIPPQGRIHIIRDRQPVDKNTVLAEVRRASFLHTEDITARGWLLDVLQCVNQIPGAVFSLEDVYQFEEILHTKHPGNSHIRAKIRQQLQLLRNKGQLEFLEPGTYRKL